MRHEEARMYRRTHHARRHGRLRYFIAMLAALLVSTLTLVGSVGSADAAGNNVKLGLRPSSTQLARCMPNSIVHVVVQLTTDSLGYDVFTLNARGLPPNTQFTVFLL